MATTATQALDWVGRLYRVLSHRRPEIDDQFDYFEGKQPLAYASDSWKKFHQDRYRDFSDNWCGVVGRSPVDRLRIDGIRVGDDAETLSADEKTLWDDWKRNDLATQSKQGFLASTIAKRSSVIVWGDENDVPTATWEHPAQVAVASDPATRVRRAALKAWVDDDREYATLFLPDSVWKFERPSFRVTDGRTDSGLVVPSSFTADAGGWGMRQPAEDDTWPLSNPLGEVPVVEWLNRPMLGMDPLSDIQGTIAMQNAINMLWAYLFTAADHASMPARVVLGAEPPKIPILDGDGQIIGSKPAKLEDLAEGRLLFLPGVGANARIDQWDAAKLDVFTSVVDVAVGHVAAQTSTPGHYLLTNSSFANLNGDALTAAETPLAKKVETAQEFYNSPARETFRLMAKVRGNDGLADAIRLSTIVWKDAAMHSLAQVADAATKDASVGLPLAYILETRYGLSQPDIARVLEMRRAEQRLDPEAFLDPTTLAAMKGGAAGGDAVSAAGA